MHILKMMAFGSLSSSALSGESAGEFWEPYWVDSVWKDVSSHLSVNGRRFCEVIVLFKAELYRMFHVYMHANYSLANSFYSALIVAWAFYDFLYLLGSYISGSEMHLT